MAFDPDEYLRLTRRDADADPEGFDPDAYLGKQDFDPDKYLKGEPGLLTSATDIPRSVSGGAWQSLGRGVQGLVELNNAAGRKLSSLFPEKIENFLNDPDNLPDALDVPAAIHKLGQGAEGVGDFVSPPQERENLGTDVAKGVGQVVVQAAATFLNPVMGTALMAGEGAEGQSRRAESAGEAGTAQADSAIIEGAAVTAVTERIQLGRLMKHTPYLGKLVENLPASLREKWLGKVIDVGAAGIGEALQEVTEGVVNDAIEYANYNEDVEFLEGWEREAKAAGLTGAIFRATINAMTPGKARGTPLPERESVEDAPLPEAETQDPQAERIIEEPKVPAVESDGPKVNRGTVQSMPLNAEGGKDILNEIEELGGVKSPRRIKNRKEGEYEDFGEVFTGLSKRLVRDSEDAEALDQLVKPLRARGYDVTDTNDLKERIREAMYEREQIRQKVAQEQATGRWYDQAMSGRRAKNQPKAELMPQVASKMLVGDTFKVSGNEVRVVDVDSFTGEVTLETSEKLGGRHVIEPEDEVFFDRRSYRFGQGFYQRQTEEDLGDSMPFARRDIQDPQTAWRSAIQAHETRDPQQRWQMREQLAQRQAAWRERVEKLAPGVMKRFQLQFGTAQDLARSGRVDARTLTGTEQAAYNAQERIFYLFDEGLTRGSEANSLVNLQHEIAHAHWDTLPDDLQTRLETQWEQEVTAKTGPLFRNGNVRRGVAEGIETDLREWYAERIAWTNHRWAREKLGMPAPISRENGTVARAARYLRDLLKRVQAFYSENFGADKVVRDFRSYLEQGERWEPNALPAARPVRERMEMAPAFARRELDAAKEVSKTPQELRARLRTLRERFKSSPVGRLIRKELTTTGTMPEAAWKRMAERDQRVAAVTREADFALKDLNKAVKKTYGGWSSLPRGMERKLNDVMAGRGRWQNIPPALLAPLVKMRQSVDRMSKRLIEEGYATGELRGVIEDRMGFYLHRSYKRYDLKGWGDKVMQAKPGSELAKVRESARKLIHDMMREDQLQKLADAEYMTRAGEAGPLAPVRPQAAPDAPGQAIQQEMPVNPAKPKKVSAKDRRTPLYWEILDRLRADKDLQPDSRKVEGLLASLAGAGDTAVPEFSAGATKLSKDLTIFKKRKSIDPRIRKLMGEYSDVRINFARSMSKIAQVVETHKMLEDVKELGLQQGWMSEDGPTGELNAEIAAEGSKTLEPLNGMHTTKEIAEVFKDQMAGTPAGFGWRAWWWLNGWAKVSKTVLSPVAQMGNVAANFWPMVANGYLNVRYAKKVGEAIQGDLASNSPQKARDYVVRLTRLGVLGESVNANELREAMRNAHVMDGGNVEKWTEGVIAKTMKTPFRAAAKAYQLGDEMFRVYAFEHERARWAEALPNASAGEIDAVAAERVNNVLATYSRIPKFFQRIRRGGLTGSFVSFSMESMRTLYHTVKYAAEDLRSPNPAIRRMGAMRAAGIVATAGVGLPVVQMISQAITGVSNEDDEDYRKVLAPWNRNSTLLYLEKGKGNFRAVDASRLSYYGYPHKILTAALSGEDWEAALLEAAGEAVEPVFGEGLVAKAIVDVLRNQTDDGRTVVQRGSEGWDVTRQKLEHLYKAVEPGAITQARRVWRAATGYESETGRTYDLQDELAATFTGARPLSVDMLRNYAFKIGDYAGTKGDAAAVFWREWNSNNSDRESVLAAYQDANAKRKKAFDDMSELTGALLRQGVSPREIVRTLYQRGISEDETVRLMVGVYEDWNPKLNPRDNPENQEKRIRGLGL